MTLARRPRRPIGSMQAHVEEFEEDEGPLTEGEYEEGLDDDYDDEDEEYDEEADLLDDDDLDGEEPDDDEAKEGFIRGLEPLQNRGGPGGPGLPPRRQTPRPESAATKQWKGLDSLPEATRDRYVKLLGQLRSERKEEITVLILGKFFTGKSLTVNSLLNEDVAPRTFMQRSHDPPAVYSRAAHGFKMTIIDAAGLTDADSVSEKRMEDLVSAVQDRTIDVLLYVDRFDTYRIDGADEQVLRAISTSLGAGIWNNAIIGLTYARENINGYAWEDFKAKRAERLRQAVRKFAHCPAAELPVAFIENSPTCEKNDAGEKILPDNTAWLPFLMEQIVHIVTSQPAFSFNSKAVERAANPNNRHRWLIPVVFAAQIALKFFVFDRLMEDDKLTGDRHGPFVPSVVKANRMRAAAEKEAAKNRSQRRPVTRSLAAYDSDSD